MTDRFQRGYIILSRDLFDSSLWQLPPDHFRVAVYLLSKARHKNTPHKFPDGTTVCRGELVTSMLLIAENCSYHENRMMREMSRQKASRIVKTLENIGFLTHNSDKVGTHITICNYETYQNPTTYNLDSSVTAVTNPQPTLNQPPTTNKKGNNVKKGNNEKKKKRGGFTPPTPDQVSEYFKEKGHPETEAYKFHAFYTSNGWKVGRNPMKCWKAASSGWISRSKSYGQNKDIMENYESTLGD